MGRAYEVRKASIQKTGAVKAKLYSLYAREIYQLAKTGGPLLESNIPLKRLVDKAKKDQIPGDIIKRAIDKVSSGADENYSTVKYEIFGPSGSTLIVSCLTDNVNRTLSHIRPILNKNNAKMGASGSVIYMYDLLSVVQLKELTETEVLDIMINKEIEIDDIEIQDDIITIYGHPEDFYKIKEAIKEIKPDIEFLTEEITYLPKEKVKLSSDDLVIFNKIYNLLEELEDVQYIYYNVDV